MKKFINPVLALMAVLLIFSGCHLKNKWPVNFPEGAFPDTAKNLAPVNSTFDDYNSAGPPTLAFSIPLVFSSNRNSNGEDYDLVEYQLYASFNQFDGSLSITAERYATYPFYYLTQLSNTDNDEFGPYIAPLGSQEYFFLFSSNRTGNMEIYTSFYDQYTFGGGSQIGPEPFRIKGLNTPDYDAYATMSIDLDLVIFCSNRDGNLDLYQAALPTEPGACYEWARTDTLYPATPITQLNSDAADACPFINGNLLVFTSKRAGGYGGYDLYYSVYDGDKWQDPVNFGPLINSPYNEFRPATFYAPYFSNDLMIFSSDRPGGRGGFDLYYVGISKLIL
ncbi:MAG: PD40 domain-containing protein [Bacteroidales bacterium]|nr:PD40 domain-containing protein [Bacteroidales bacterium]